MLVATDAVASRAGRESDCAARLPCPFLPPPSHTAVPNSFQCLFERASGVWSAQKTWVLTSPSARKNAPGARFHTNGRAFRFETSPQAALQQMQHAAGVTLTTAGARSPAPRAPFFGVRSKTVRCQE